MAKGLLVVLALAFVLGGFKGCNLGSDVNKQAQRNEKVCQEAPDTPKCGDPLYNVNSWRDYNDH